MYTDRPRDFDRDDYWASTPGLVAIAGDPTHRRIEVESFSGGKVAKLFAALRKIRCEFAPSSRDGPPAKGSARGYYCQGKAPRNKVITMSRGERDLYDRPNWGQQRCADALRILDDNGYIKKPFKNRGARRARSRAEMSRRIWRPNAKEKRGFRRRDNSSEGCTADLLRISLQRKPVYYRYGR